ncbi:MAG TPA: aspartate 1-decarboxylase [Desulfobacterales bacterium]|jgi:aspartate 1-decarboxylase|nr:aspartate 1-decarboxylase [Desulfobacterales bacterium]
MLRFVLKSKIHRATLTGTVLHYEGSITIARELLQAADIFPGEQVHVLNINNGSRVVTYAIEGEANSGVVSLNGAAARMGEAGDKIIVISYALLPEDEALTFEPKVILVAKRNKIQKVRMRSLPV